MTTNPAIAEVLGFFDYSHLPPSLQEVSKTFHDLGHETAQMETRHESTVLVGLHRLLVAKDCAVRAALDCE